MQTRVFKDAVTDAYCEAKGVLGDEVKAASLRGFFNMYMEPHFYVDDPQGLLYLKLRFEQCDMISKLKCGGQEDLLLAYTKLSQTNVDEAVSATWLFFSSGFCS